jgi:hypothetical protein
MVMPPLHAVDGVHLVSRYRNEGIVGSLAELELVFWWL